MFLCVPLGGVPTPHPKLLPKAYGPRLDPGDQEPRLPSATDPPSLQLSFFHFPSRTLDHRPPWSSASRSPELHYCVSHTQGLFSAAVTPSLSRRNIPDCPEPASCRPIEVAVQLEWRTGVLGLTRARPGMQRPSLGTGWITWPGQVPVSFGARVGRRQTENMWCPVKFECQVNTDSFLA